MKLSWVILLALIGVACCMSQSGRASGFNKYYNKPSLKNKNTEAESPFSFMKIITFIANMFIGSGDKNDTGDSSASSRQIFNLVMAAVDFLQNSFKQRSATYRARGASNTINEGVEATLYLVKGLVRSTMTSDQVCREKYVCQASSMATKSGSVGYMISQVSTQIAGNILGGSDNSYNSLSTAGRRGRNGDDCEFYYNACNETE